jgi:hypothetical protein
VIGLVIFRIRPKQFGRFASVFDTSVMTIDIVMLEELAISSHDYFYVSSCLQFVLDIMKDPSTVSCTCVLEP